MKKGKEIFSRKVIRIVSGIPRGKVLSYKDVARHAGNPKAARAVGNILNRRYRECKEQGRKTIPCHRVVRSDGGVGGYAGGEKEKRRLLRREGISFARYQKNVSQKFHWLNENPALRRGL
ncbi:MAG: MGMT family protein [Patescibacteria group bacterium]|nr:MGMT family protein [Patescibacteria group bacterium]